MAAGSAFTLVPNLVTTLVPEYNNVQSQTESMKKEYLIFLLLLLNHTGLILMPLQVLSGIPY
jgi:hypothetical protein